MAHIDWKKVLLSCVLSALILFGGWFIYEYFNQDKPLYSWFEQNQTVELVDLHVDREQVKVVVRFHDSSRFEQDYHNLTAILQQLNKNYQIVIDPGQNIFHSFWKEHGTVMAQFIELKEYGRLSNYILELKEKQEIADGYATITPEGLFLYIELAEQDELYVHFPTSLWRGGEAVEG